MSTPPPFHGRYSEILRLVKRYARKLGAGRDLDDVVQEALIAIANAWPSYDPARPLEPWVWTITARTVWSFKNLAFNRKRGPEEDLDQRAAEDASPEEHAVYEERYAMLLELLRPMKEDRRIVFTLKEIDDFSMSEIAEMLEIPIDTAYSRLRLAWEEIEKRLARTSKQTGPGRFPGVAALPPFLKLVRAQPPADVDLDDAPPEEGGRPAEDHPRPKRRDPHGGGDPDGGAPPPDGGAPSPGGAPWNGGSLASSLVKASTARLVSGGLLMFALGAGAGAAAHALIGGGAQAPGPQAVALDTSRQRAPDVAPSAEDERPPREAPAPQAALATTAASPAPRMPPPPGTGATGSQASLASPPVSVASARSVDAGVAAVAIAAVDAGSAAVAIAAVDVAASATAAPSGAAPTADPEARSPERLWIEEAGIALDNGDLPRARRALRQHEQQFPTSKWASRRQELWERLRQLEATKKP